MECGHAARRITAETHGLVALGRLGGFLHAGGDFRVALVRVAVRDVY
jgi:hypothetical protein